jgi:hypothetical protein
MCRHRMKANKLAGIHKHARDSNLITFKSDKCLQITRHPKTRLPISFACEPSAFGEQN